MTSTRKRWVVGILSVLLVLGGTFATGLLPSELPYQVFAGALIVLGFLIPYVYFVGIDIPE